MGNKYLEKVAELQEVEMLEKQAFDPLGLGLGYAGHAALTTGLHAFQNATTAASLRDPRFAKEVAHHFHAGLNGKLSPSKSFSIGNMISGVAGAVNPELNIMRSEAYHAGHQLKGHLTNAGFDPGNLPRKVKVALARSANGDFAALKAKHANDPLVMRALGAMEKVTGHPVQTLVKGTDKGIEAAGKAWKDNPISGNIIRSIGTGKHDVSKLKDGYSGNMTTRGMVGAVATGLVDPLAGGLNALKVGMSDKKLVKAIPGAQRVTDYVTKKFAVDDVKHGLETGLAGKRTSQTRQAFDKFIGSPILGEVKDLANRVGVAANEGGYHQIVAQGKETVRRAKAFEAKHGNTLRSGIAAADKLSGKVADELKPQGNKYLNKLNASAAAGGVAGGAGIAAATSPDQPARPQYQAYY